MNKMKIKIVCMGLILLLITACKQEQDVNFKDNDKPPIQEDTSIVGTKWTSVFKTLDDNVLAMATYNNKLYLSYLYYENGRFANGGEFDASVLKHQIQSMGNSSGFERYRVIDGNLYGIGSVGNSPVWRAIKDSEEDGPYWEKLAASNTAYNDFIIYNGVQIGATHFEPYLRVSSGPDLGKGFDNSVYCLQVFKGELYAGGDFKDINGTTCNGIAKWNGITWEALGEGFEDGTVSEMIVFQNKLIAYGKIYNSGETKLNKIAMWDGNAWDSLGSGLSVSRNTLGSLLVYDNELYVGGDFEYAGGIYSPYLAKWDGDKWHAMPLGIPSFVGSIEVFRKKLYIASDSYNDNFILRLE